MATSAWTPVDEAAAKWTPVEDDKPAFKAAPKAGSAGWWKEHLYNAIDVALESLPAVGATGGALVGGSGGTLAAPGPGSVAGAIGGAGIGGMAGEAARQIGRHAMGYSAPQTSGEAMREITKQGVIQGAVQGVTEALPMAAEPLKRAALRQYERALAPTTVENKIIAKDIAPEMIKRGVRGSLPQIEEQAAAQASALRPELAQAYNSVPSHAMANKSPVSQTLTALDGLKGKYMVDGKVVNPQAVNAIEGVQQVVEQHANNISPQSLRRVKQIFDEAVSEAGGFTNADLTTNYALKAQREAGNRIRAILHDTAPNAAAADKEMSFWLDVQQVSRATNLRRSGQEGGLLKTFTPLASAGAGAVGLAGGKEVGLGAAGMTFLAGYVAQAMKQPAWRTTSAIVKDRLADALVRGDARMTASLLGRLGVGVPVAEIFRAQPNRSEQPQE